MARSKPKKIRQNDSAIVDDKTVPPVNGPRPDRHWNAMFALHPEHPALQAETIYALPAGLIAAIRETVPGLFIDEDFGFEIDLANLAGAGFFCRRRFVHPLLPAAALSDEEITQHQDRERKAYSVDLSIHEMLTVELKQRGAGPTEVSKYFDEEDDFEERCEARRWGYAGWLSTNPGFRGARDELRNRWGNQIQQQGGFPEMPWSVFGEQEPAVPEQDRELYDDFLTFYKQWSLDGLATWELPIPLYLRLGQPTLYRPLALSGAGVEIFVPWYLLRDKDIKLRDVLEHRQSFDGPAQLAEWLAGEPKNWGYARFQLMMRLYIWWELALRPRYGDRLKGKTEALDRAVASYLSSDSAQAGRAPAGEADAETVRKVRQQMSKLLDNSANDRREPTGRRR